MTTIMLPSPEPKATIIGFTPDGSPIWGTRQVSRIRDRKAGWIEVEREAGRGGVMSTATTFIMEN